MRFLVSLGLFLVSFPMAHSATWLSTVDAYSQPRNLVGQQFMQLFESTAPWNGAAAKTQVLKVSTQFLHQANDVEVSAVLRGLEQRHILLGMEGLLLVASDRCGRGIESYSGPGVIPAVAARVKRLGGTIGFVAMDEPLWFGNGRDGPRNCRDSPEYLAEQLAPNVQALRAAFPDVLFGDIEPLAQKTIGRIDLILQFAEAFKAASGNPISFVHADIIWQQNWQPQLIEWKVKLHNAGIKFGVIFDGDPRDQSDGEWISHAIERYHAVTSDVSMRPDDAIFQSWMSRPTLLLPDSDPETLTGLVRRAVP